ncbi:MAG: hypothetical protein ABGW77_01105, partial [Campylobacterales bacterium]
RGLRNRAEEKVEVFLTIMLLDRRGYCLLRRLENQLRLRRMGISLKGKTNTTFWKWVRAVEKNFSNDWSIGALHFSAIPGGISLGDLKLGKWKLGGLEIRGLEIGGT